MSSDTTDEALLRQYVKHQSEAAFAQLVRRHHALVYATCRREVGDADLAEDAAQAVFLILAQKASSLRAGSGLARWLFQTARFAARNLVKQEYRRRQREQKAVELAQQGPPPENGLWERVEPALNDSLAHLSPGDREAVELRFFAGQSLAEVGAVLGVGENTARMRVTRAIDRMRRHLARKGVPVTPAALAALLSEKAGEASRLAGPAGAALSHSLATASVQQLAQGVLRAMWIKTVFTTAAVSAVTGAAITVPLVAASRHVVPSVIQARAVSPGLAKTSQFSPTLALPAGAGLPASRPNSAAQASASPVAASPASTHPADATMLPAVVAAGPIIQKIMFTANTPDGRPSVPYSALEWAMNTKVGQAYDADAVARDLDRLLNHRDGFMRSMGYIVDIGPGLNFDPDKGVLTIPLVEAHVSKITITGNQKTPSADILKQLQVQSGDVLNENTLQYGMTRIYNMGLFSQVGPWQETPTGVGQDDVTVPVVEK